MEITDIFRHALVYILKEKGRGAQSRLADDSGISRTLLSDYINKRKPLSEAKRTIIANTLGYAYEDFIVLGRQLLEGKPIGKEKEPFPQYNEVLRLPIEERAWAILRLAAKQQGIDAFSSFHGDRNSDDKPDMVADFLSGKTTEVDLYNDALGFFGHLRKRMEDELKKRGF